jgi:hypothetical protein
MSNNKGNDEETVNKSNSNGLVGKLDVASLEYLDNSS